MPYHPARTPEDLKPAVDLSETVSLDRVTTRIGDIPYPDRSLFGYGHSAVYKVNGREQLPGNWRWDPETCLVTDQANGIWLDEAHLSCPGCGLDCT